MRQPRRSQKRKRPPEDMPSSATVEIITVMRDGNRLKKKRIVEKAEFDPTSVPFSLPDVDGFSTPLFQEEPSQPPDDNSNETTPAVASRSVSVRILIVLHAATSLT